jgi:hypothetical protein
MLNSLKFNEIFDLNLSFALDLFASSLTVGGKASLATASAQKPERTGVREDFEHCPASNWRVSQVI